MPRQQRVYATAYRNGQCIIDSKDIALNLFLDSLPKENNILVTGPGAPLATNYSPQIILDPMYIVPRGGILTIMAKELFKSEGGDPPDIGLIYLREALLNSVSEIHGVVY